MEAPKSTFYTCVTQFRDSQLREAAHVWIVESLLHPQGDVLFVFTMEPYYTDRDVGPDHDLPERLRTTLTEASMLSLEPLPTGLELAVVVPMTKEAEVYKRFSPYLRGPMDYTKHYLPHRQLLMQMYFNL